MSANDNETSRKAWWKSKTLRINTVAGVLAAAELKLGLIQPFVPVNVFVALAIGLPIVNALLRPFTTQPIGWRDCEQSGTCPLEGLDVQGTDDAVQGDDAGG